MKRIAIFCDGTWNRADARFRTNVMELSRAVLRTEEDGITQQVIYVAGVGTGRGTSRASRWLDKLTGGAFGWGLAQNIEEAYWHLAFNYEPNDEIFLFGFSRGAFTARSLAGLIRSCGIPPVENIQRIPEAMRSYEARGPENHPDAPGSLKFRAEFSPRVATSKRDVDYREEEGFGAAIQLELAYLGVWDTVGSLGVPNQLMISKHWNRKYQFHNLNLSRSVASARHAVAVDERRKNFMPALWDNLDDLNGDREGVARDYQQLWFPGDHSAIGGGGDNKAFSAKTLEWVAEGATRQGLRFNTAMLDELTEPADAFGDVRGSTEPPSWLGRVLRWSSADRDPPDHRGVLAEFTTLRLNEDRSYRPKTLEPFWPE
ncbi:DUF2235 domain-containing protein [Psychromarinibacter sp. C21-152]|uniref:DUF2235 domain-containing protein n=1 Tax=Psychromarinibacter sediminicola TaxID=3033385 RepID=A0AAE3NP63_9RHOB|nr:DUF2235 domain-containing protein [Psychromarinibacter sediminicola]MDF0599442.1 DUF2235 domain-containing protein [Psychromarinibacter sediminicola]